MEMFFITFIVLLCSLYIFFHIKKILTKVEKNPKCANCAINKILMQSKKYG
jgi:hypothetical protein